MDHFFYKNNKLFAEDASIEAIANNVKTPFYCYSSATIEHHYNVFSNPLKKFDSLVCYAMKANPNIAIVKTLADMGAGVDVVSRGELLTALKAGVNPQKIVFSGVGKTQEEHELAIKSGILQINIESSAELLALSETARSLNLTAPIALRVNPDVAVNTHAKITTGKKENKFGIEWGKALELYNTAASLKNISICGIDVHIGSQLLDLEPFQQAFIKIRELVIDLRRKNINIKNIDLGGGLGIPYEKQGLKTTPLPSEYAQIIENEIADLQCKIILEPGRLIMGNAGILVTKVLYVKETSSKRFLIVDAAMNDLIRPALYDAYHEMKPVIQPQHNNNKTFDIVGPVCESGDILGKEIPLPSDIKAGDLIAIETAGAYGASMSSTYNSRPLIPEVLVKNQHFAIIRKRPSYEEMTSLEKLPPWL